MTLFGSIMFLKTILSSGGQGVHMKFGGKHFIPCSPSPLHILCQTAASGLRGAGGKGPGVREGCGPAGDRSLPSVPLKAAVAPAPGSRAHPRAAGSVLAGWGAGEGSVCPDGLQGAGLVDPSAPREALVGSPLRLNPHRGTSFPGGRLMR